MGEQIVELLKLAWDRSKDTIRRVLDAIFGAMFFVSIFVLHYIANYINNGKYYLSLGAVPDTGVLTIGGMAVGSAFINTVCTLLFLSILFCLAIYTASFCEICYYYDNKSWATINWINKQFEKFKLWQRIKSEKRFAENERYKVELFEMVEIIKSRK